jgi:hypothetical protein
MNASHASHSPADLAAWWNQEGRLHICQGFAHYRRMLLDRTVRLTREESEGVADFLSLVEGIVVMARIESEAAV